MSGNDTVAAVATAQGRAGVAVVRVSGPDAFLVASRVCDRTLGGGDEAFPRVARTSFFDPVTSKPVDDGLVLLFKSPSSYTGEDVAEFQCHGGAIAPRRVLEAAFAAGARLARRGEFTQRALLNGKIDISQAEGILSMIDALTDRAASAAYDRMRSRPEKVRRALYDEAVRISSVLEHALDVSEDELPDGFLKSILSSVSALESSVRAAAAASREGKILRDGARVVLSGAPNVGKSSLFNALLEESRAIVSDTPGTTRDSIEEWVDIAGWPVCLVDTAGLRETEDEVEEEGVRRAKTLAGEADILLKLEESSQSSCSSLPESGKMARPLAIKVLTKADVSKPVKTPPGCVAVSSLTGEGIASLKEAIASSLAEIAGGAFDDAFDPGAERLGEVASSLREAGRSGDIVLAANAVRAVAEKLGSLVGAAYSEDLLDSLFSRFCVGK